MRIDSSSKTSNVLITSLALVLFFSCEEKNKCDVYFLGMPEKHTGLWKGENIDNMVIMRQKRTGPKSAHLESRLTFYNIDDHSFDWKGELWDLDKNTVQVNWKIKASRE